MVLTEEELEKFKPERPRVVSREGTPTQRGQDTINYMRMSLANTNLVGGEGPESLEGRKLATEYFLSHLDEPVFSNRLSNLYVRYPDAFLYLDEDLDGKTELTDLLFAICSHEGIHYERVYNYVYSPGNPNNEGGTKPMEWVYQQWLRGQRLSEGWHAEAQALYDKELDKYRKAKAKEQRSSKGKHKKGRRHFRREGEGGEPSASGA
jgi:hypothetical protein